MLSVILGYAELLRFRLPKDAPIQACVEEIAQAAQRSAHITSQLLALARRQVVEPAVIDPRLLLSQMQGMLESLLGERCRLELVVGSESGSAAIEVDVAQLEQVIANLRDRRP